MTSTQKKKKKEIHKPRYYNHITLQPIHPALQAQALLSEAAAEG
jgi:hypothetical protein